MSLLTNWGYTINNIDILPNIMDVTEYANYTGRNDDDSRVNAEIAAACAAIRNYVGWHLAPAAECKLNTMMFDRRVNAIGDDILIQLPARYVPSVSSVKINNVEQEHFFCDTNGLLHVFGTGFMVQRYDPVEVIYTAGLGEKMLDPIKELIAHRVTHAIAVPPGITSEASGGVSVTYNAGWINNSRATALAGDNKELLIPYRVTGVF